MNLKKLKQHWNSFAKIDPLWSIYPEPSKMNRKWDIDEFFKTGEIQIDYIFRFAEHINISIKRRRALDFGCGVGRLTQALCKYFEECTGVDIAPSMIEQARELNRHGQRCKYVVNESDNLKIFQSDYFDFIYSLTVLQHINPQYSRHYLKEFLRVLVPDGILIVQIPNKIRGKMISGLTDVGQQSSLSTIALPPSGFKAKLTILEAPLELSPGNLYEMMVRVGNISDTAWKARDTSALGQINLGNHWLTPDQQYFVFDDNRAPLPRGIKPNEELDLTIMVRAPQQAGTYWLEFDMVQENVSWFKVKGSETARIGIRVKQKQLTESKSASALTAPSNPKPDDQERRDIKPEIVNPIMEMHGIPRQEVIRLIKRFGGTIIDIQADQAAGQEWESLSYCVRK
jgi:SAM-dependent methyltransferase